MKKLLMAAGVWQLVRMGRRRLGSVRRRRRRERVAVSILALAAGAGGVYYLISSQRGTDRQRWPSRKKLEREARQAEARLRAQQGNERPPDMRVERNSATDLKVPLGEVKR